MRSSISAEGVLPAALGESVRFDFALGALFVDDRFEVARFLAGMLNRSEVSFDAVLSAAHGAARSTRPAVGSDELARRRTTQGDHCWRKSSSRQSSPSGGGITHQSSR
jgi:hypothetical protein